MLGHATISLQGFHCSVHPVFVSPLGIARDRPVVKVLKHLRKPIHSCLPISVRGITDPLWSAGMTKLARKIGKLSNAPMRGLRDNGNSCYSAVANGSPDTETVERALIIEGSVSAGYASLLYSP